MVSPTVSIRLTSLFDQWGGVKGDIVITGRELSYDGGVNFHMMGACKSVYIV